MSGRELGLVVLSSGSAIYLEGDDLGEVVRALRGGDWLVISWWRVGPPYELMQSLMREARCPRSDAWLLVMPTPHAMPRVSAIRAAEGSVPVIVASDGSADAETALLRAGADLHCRWPEEAAVLGARVHSLLRRASGTFVVSAPGGLDLRRQTRTLRVEGSEVQLSAVEYRVIERLNEQLNQWVSSDELWPILAGAAERYDSSRLRMILLRIRQKLGSARWAIRSERGKGVMLTTEKSYLPAVDAGGARAAT